MTVLTPAPTSLRSLNAPASATAPTAPTALPLAPREVARSLADRPDLWRPLVRYRDPRFHTRLATGPDWEAWLLTWLPGQSTGLHDHGGSAGAFAVLVGSVDESLPLRSPAALRSAQSPGSPGGADERAEPVRLISRRYRAGQVRAFGTEHLHDVGARSGRRAVTLHVYAPRLTTMTRYEPADGRLVVTGREQEGQDW